MHDSDSSTQAGSSPVSPSRCPEGLDSEGTAEGILLQLADGTIAACNPAAEQLLGLTAEQLQGWTSIHSPWQAIHEDGSNFPGETHPAMVALQTGQPQSGVMGLYHPNGHLNWLQIDAQPLFQAPSIPYGVMVKFRQIPREKPREIPGEIPRENLKENPKASPFLDALAQLNQTLNESQERNELAMEVARMFAFEWELSTDVVKRSAHCGSILGLTGDEIEQDTGANFFQRVHPDDRDRFAATVQALTPANSTYRTIYRVTCPNGAIVTLEESARGLFNEQRQMIRLIGMTVDITERRQTEESLRASQAQLQQQLAEIEAIYQSAPIGLNVLDTDLRFVRINQRLAEMNGFPVEAHLGRTVRELLPDVADSAEQLLRPILETGEPLLNVEIRGETPAQPGVERIWLEHFLPLKSGDPADGQSQKIIGISTVCEEITERRRHELALQEAYIQLEAALAAGSIYTWRWKVRENLVITDRQLAELFGVDPEAATGEGVPVEAFLNAIHPDDRAEVIAAIDRAVTTGEAYEAEYRVHNAAGEERWVIARGRAEYDEQGNPVAFPGATADITIAKQREAELKRTEEALRQSEEFKDRMLQSSPDCIKVLDLEGRLLYINTGGMHSMEIDDFAPLYRADWVCFWQDDRQQAEQAMAAAKSGEVYIFSGYCPTVKGTPKWWEVVVSPILNAAGQVERVLSISRDITDRKRAEQEHERMLQTEQLLRTEAERANRIKDEFLAVLSHELRTPLNPILGWVKLLQGGKLTAAKTAEALAVIERNAKLQSQLVEDLLDVSRILRGKLKLNVGVVNLSETISAALETVCHAADAKNIQLDLALGEVRPLMGDADRLQQVVWNLLSNAIKFTPNGGRVAVKLKELSGGAGEQGRVPITHPPIHPPTHPPTHLYAQITVTDTGKGIHPDFLPYVFDHFRQEDGTTTRRFGGLGLGLAIVRQIVEMHGGIVRADSPGDGQGATFTVTLPLSCQASPIPDQDFPAAAVNPSAVLTGVRVLVVDDDIDSREFIAFVLAQTGAVVVEASSAIEGLQILSQSRFDLLLSDIGMPEMDGYTFLCQVRARPAESGGEIPAIALTAYAGELNRTQAIQAGFQLHLAKPIEMEEMTKAIVTLLAK